MVAIQRVCRPKCKIFVALAPDLLAVPYENFPLDTDNRLQQMLFKDVKSVCSRVSFTGECEKLACIFRRSSRLELSIPRDFVDLHVNHRHVLMELASSESIIFPGSNLWYILKANYEASEPSFPAISPLFSAVNGIYPPGECKIHTVHGCNRHSI